MTRYASLLTSATLLGVGCTDAARRTIERCRYEPGRLHGQAVRVLLEQEITFSLPRRNSAGPERRGYAFALR